MSTLYLFPKLYDTKEKPGIYHHPCPEVGNYHTPSYAYSWIVDCAKFCDHVAPGHRYNALWGIQGHAILDKWGGSDIAKKHEERYGFTFCPRLTVINDQYLLVQFMCNIKLEAIEKVIEDTELWNDVWELFGNTEDIVDRPPMWFRVGLYRNPLDNI
ncbi:hypothetical protein NLJ89_g9963 [Agrocybe chaxingu]|uniref:Uncharacterized protein n=1 Tax=Agrocybe chaxingu TaxID=84603 RepID=A0A9W8JV01_9AGAR|nr:hypothetical protein NLJ89_g9963 [Agrocybe chaxingu]